MLRRERVFERDIFRFGTGTVIVLNLGATKLNLLLVLRWLSIAYFSDLPKSRPFSPDQRASITSWT